MSEQCDHRFTNQPLLTRDFCVRCFMPKPVPVSDEEAEKPETVVERAWREHPDDMARAHTELQVSALRERVAELEAAIQAVHDLADKAEHGATRWADPLPVPEWVDHVRAVLTAPSTVLAAVKRETAAQAWDRGFEAGEQDVMEHNRTSWSSDCIANPYRSGTEGSES